jgi:prolyl-tRNA editing enzyme YbaK/EbsC (Cys-tRNA(Pro) deacylase)
MRDNVITAARRLGLDVRVAHLGAPARTVDAAAIAVGCDESRVARTEVFVADGEPVAVVTAGRATVDPDRLCALLDCAEVRRASASEVRAVTGFPATGICCIGHDLPVVLDEALLEHERVWTLAGDATSFLEVPVRELAERLGATVGSVASTNGSAP